MSTGRCPVCGERLRLTGGRWRCFQRDIARNEKPNPARYTYGEAVVRRAVDAHLRAWLRTKPAMLDAPAEEEYDRESEARLTEGYNGE